MPLYRVIVSYNIMAEDAEQAFREARFLYGENVVGVEER